MRHFQFLSIGLLVLLVLLLLETPSAHCRELKEEEEEELIVAADVADVVEYIKMKEQFIAEMDKMNEYKRATSFEQVEGDKMDNLQQREETNTRFMISLLADDDNCTKCEPGSFANSSK